jgi:uncharacterized protein (UPF0332 family)
MLWNDFQDTAERLARGATEADWRSAISRTYYAAFHFFRKFFLRACANSRFLRIMRYEDATL